MVIDSKELYKARKRFFAARKNRLLKDKKQNKDKSDKKKNLGPITSIPAWPVI